MTRISARELSSSEGPFGRSVPIQRPEGVPEGSVVTVLRVPPEAVGMRLDRFVQSQLKRTSRTRAQTIIRRGAYAPDARPLRGNDRVRAEQCILLWRAPWDEKAPSTTLRILHEDPYLLAVDKPAGIPVHPTARYHASTVVKILEAARPDERLRLSHRIDRETSGVLLLTRTGEADRLVKAQFEEKSRPRSAEAGVAHLSAAAQPSGEGSTHRRRNELAVAGQVGASTGGQVMSPAGVTKHYLAITWGWPERDRFRIDAPLELDPSSRYKVKMRTAREGTGLRAATVCDVLERRLRPATGRRYALVRCALETGRQHQIRVHLASLGWPLVGDKLYGPDEELFARGVDGVLTDEDRALLELERHALHAEMLELDHPIHGGRVRIEAALPTDLATFWAQLHEPSC